MKRLARASLIAVAAAWGVVLSASWGQDATVADALQKIKSYRFGESREPLAAVQDLVRASLASPEKSKELAAQLTALLATDSTLDCKQFVCRQLVLVGNAECVPALAKLLEKPDTADMARYALERIPGPAADKALNAALPDAAVKTKIGIINSLGERRSFLAVPVLRRLIASADPAVREAAITALGKIGTVNSAQALAAARRIAPAQLRVALRDAELVCAERLMADGYPNKAARIYESLRIENEPRQVRVAAFRGLVRAKGGKGAHLVWKEAWGNDSFMRGMALELMRELPGEEASTVFAANLGGMASGAVQYDRLVDVIHALAERGDKTARCSVAAWLGSDNEAVRLAALAAMAKLGDESTVMMLASIAARTQGAERDTARSSLDALRGKEVDAAILGNIKEGEAPVRAELMRSVGARGITSATPMLLALTADPDEQVRAAAFGPIAQLAAENDLPALVGLLVNAKSDAERAEAEKAVVNVAAKKVADANRKGAAVLAALPGASDPRVKTSLVGVLGRIGDNTTLDAIRAALKDSDATVQEAAVRALVQWPNAAVLDDLLSVAKNDVNESHRAAAIEGYVRLLALPSDRPAGDVLKRYKEILDVAKTPAEKRSALASLDSARMPGAMTLVEPYLADEALQSQACATIVAIARSIGGACQEEVRAVIPKVLAVGKDEFIRSQAQDIVKSFDRFEDYIVAWHVAGPWKVKDKNGSELIDFVFPPEDPKAGSVAWRIMPVDAKSEHPWLLDLAEAFGPENDAVAYLRTCVVSSTDQEAQAELGSDDAVKVWLNGEQVHANNAARGCTPGEDKFTVKLKKGENTLVLKVINFGSDWGACIRFRTANGGLLRDLKATVK